MESIEALEAKIKEASQAYYESDSPIMSDEEFDNLVERLKALKPDSSVLRVGFGATPIKKTAHKYFLGSLPKIHISKMSSSNLQGDYVLSLKLDGGSAGIYYDKDGKLEKILSRGDGHIGLDITRNLYHAVPKDFLPNSCVRGEIILSYEDFAILGGTHPRNRAVGLSQSLNIPEDQVKRLKLVCYDIMSPHNYKTKLEVLKALENIGFDIVPYIISNKVYKDVSSLDLQKFYKNSNLVNTTLPYDGIVATQMDITKKQEEIAIKLVEEISESEVISINWRLSRTGRLVPVLQIKPVEISGAHISRVTANNARYLKEMGLGLGAKIIVKRANEIIPQVVKVLERKEPILPTQCPACHSILQWVGVDLRCNSSCSNWESSIIWRILEYGKYDGCGPSRFQKFLEENNVDSLETLSTAIQNSDNPIAKNIRNHKFTVSNILYISNIKGIGGVSLKKLSSLNPNEFKNAIKSREIPDSWKSLVTTQPAFDELKANVDKIAKVLDILNLSSDQNILNLSPSQNMPKPSNKVKYCITGSLSVSRKDFINEFSQVAEFAPVNQAQYLISNEPSNSKKSQEAIKLGIQVITENGFRRIFKND